MVLLLWIFWGAVAFAVFALLAPFILSGRISREEEWADDEQAKALRDWSSRESEARREWSEYKNA